MRLHWEKLGSKRRKTGHRLQQKTKKKNHEGKGGGEKGGGKKKKKRIENTKPDGVLINRTSPSNITMVTGPKSPGNART